MTNNQQKGNSNAVLTLLVLLLVTLTGVAVYFWQNYEKEKALNDLKNDLTSTKTTGTGEMKKATLPTEPTTPEKKEPTPIKVEAKKPVIVYTPNGLFTATEIKELEKKFVNPFIDWNVDNETTTVSITVEKPSPDIPGYKYNVAYINEGGGNGGFLYGTTTPLEWWLPECMAPVGCNFTAEFKAKYPEIISIVNP